MQVIVRSEHCMASGSCRRAAPEVFGSTPEGWVTLLEERPRPDIRTAVVRAAESCPVAAIDVIDDADQ
ncbi:ferredoxin [Mycolicibacterium komossense]|uniref:Ferredoxin n=1 Tax=Mycolicibacterium komossense TaxID=1779 RepID=A0ABT3CI30_9MYCO|nr:ferredoxin [Mycolicibacterium komossense]MCV7229199.1 ferredoxin [Mycolicibacterium komossense]